MFLALMLERRARAYRFLVFLAILLVVFILAFGRSAFADGSGAAAPGLSLLAIMQQGGVPMLIAWALLSLLASLFCAMTPTPAPTSRWAGLYQLMELLAVITRQTKLTGIPAVDALQTAASAIRELPAPAEASAAAAVKPAADPPAAH